MYSSYKSEKTFVKQADSAQNKRTANEVESFKIKMFQTKDGLFFYRTRFFSTNARCWRQAQQPSANITAFPQRESRKTKSVNRSFQQE